MSNKPPRALYRILPSTVSVWNIKQQKNVGYSQNMMFWVNQTCMGSDHVFGYIRAVISEDGKQVFVIPDEEVSVSFSKTQEAEPYLVNQMPETSSQWTLKTVEQYEQLKCAKHKKELLGETDMNKVAEMIGDLHYETLTQLLTCLASKFENDARQDYDGGRVKLANALQYLGQSLFEASMRSIKVHEISKPYMKN
jgi:hypothetical protein